MMVSSYNLTSLCGQCLVGVQEGKGTVPCEFGVGKGLSSTIGGPHASPVILTSDVLSTTFLPYSWLHTLLGRYG